MRTFEDHFVLDIHLDPNQRAGGNLSAQLADELRAAIRSGRLVAPTRLPSTRSLARDLQVSRGVVVDAYEQLVAEGFAESRTGSGTWVAEAAHPAGRGAPAAPADPEQPWLDLRPGTPDLSAFPRRRWLAAVRQALASLPDVALRYPDPGGVPELRAELASYLNRVRAAQAQPDRLVVMSGIAQGMAALGASLAAAGRAIAVENPSSEGSRAVLRRAGAQVVGVPVDAHGLDVDELRRTDAGAVLVTPAHHYPTGVVLAPQRRAELVAWARDTDGLIIEDDYDAEFRYDRDPVGCLQGLAPDRVALLGTVSKALAPGLRLGWAVAPAAVTSELAAFHAHTDLGSPVLDQHALAVLLGSGGYDRHLRTMRRTYRARRDALVETLSHWLPAAHVRGVSAGIHLYVEVPGLDEQATVAAAAARGVAIGAAGSTWFADAVPPCPALVLGYAQLAERHLVEATRLLAEAVDVK